MKHDRQPCPRCGAATLDEASTKCRPERDVTGEGTCPAEWEDANGYLTQPVHDERFDAWIDELREDVIEGEFGYEPGEFIVTPQLWRPQFDEGLSPIQAFNRALRAHAYGRIQDECEQSINWARIQYEDALALGRVPAPCGRG